jgi:hypothetical protein
MKKTLFMLLLTGSVFNSYAQSLVAKGKVTDKKSTPLPGATVTLAQIQNRMVTNHAGIYSLNSGGASTTKIRTFSYISFQTQELNVAPLGYSVQKMCNNS